MRLAKNGAVLGVSVYVDDDLVAENVAFTPPAVGFASSEVQGFGATSIPAYALPEAMECSIDFVGVDAGFVASLRGREIECRWAVTSIGADGEQKTVGNKAFLKVLPKSAPAIGIGVGDAGTNTVSFDVLRYQLFVDGNEAVLVDKVAGVTKMGGVDLSGGLASVL